MHVGSARRTFRLISHGLTALVLLSGSLMLLASFKRGELPPHSEILPELEDEPEQIQGEEPAFKFDWRGEKYVVYPVAEYSITGLVVSRNDIGGFSDIYHTADSVDVVDVCLVWGKNALSGIYRQVEFWSEPFACWFNANSAETLRAFRGDQLSNTHVLAKDESLARRLSDIRIGDQITLSGRLVNYHPAGASEQVRASSVKRDDTGNGACEVMFVENYARLKRGNPGWNRLFDLAKVVFYVVLVCKVVGVFLLPYLEFRWS